MLAWPLTGRAPTSAPDVVAARHGPESTGPTLTASERLGFFAHLRAAAERASAALVAAEPASVLLRRQACYLASWDLTAEGRDWLVDVQPDEGHRRHGLHEWSPQWAAARSLVVARARQGDPEPLRHFLRTRLTSDELEAAGLNYEAYWVGETRGAKHGDDFMAGGLGSWSGVALLEQLRDRLRPAEPTVELSIHTACALVGCRPWLLESAPALRHSLGTRLHVLQADSSLSSPARSELDSLAYVLRLRRTM